MKIDKNDIKSQTIAATETHRPGNWIEVYGAREHNLKNVDVAIPRDSLTVITGLSGSGKSSLAFDTIYAEGQRRYMETLSTYARQFVGSMERPDVDKITGLSPVISIEQKTTNRNPGGNMRKKKSEYATQLNEKQKAKCVCFSPGQPRPILR